MTRRYLAVVLLLSAPIYALILRGGAASGPQFTLLSLALMWVPGLSALALWRSAGRPFPGLRWKPGAWRYVAIAVLVPALLHSGIMSAVALSGLGRLPDRLLAGPPSLAALTVFSIERVARAVLSAPINALFTLGEEIGWRGFLQPRLTARGGMAGGIVLTGLIWGYWHFPVIWVGYNFPEAPRLGAFVLMPLLCVGMAGFLGWLFARTGGVWAPALGHAAINATGGVLEMGGARGARLAIDGIVIGAWLLIGAFCLITLKQESGTLDGDD